MAEADMGDSSQRKFYCHQCELQFATVHPNFTCPHCLLGFIEEVEMEPEPKQDAPVFENSNNEEPRNMLPYDLCLQPDAFQRRRGNNRNRSSIPRASRRRSNLIHPGISRRRARRTVARRTTEVTAAHDAAPFGYLMHEMVMDLSPTSEFVDESHNVESFFSTLNFDAVFAHIRDDMLATDVFFTESPPVSKEVIDTLEIVNITPDHFSEQLQCSVCFETCVLGEPVRQLPCGHKYHDPCIRPWLLKHGTCPICRKHITANETTTDGLSTSNAARAREAIDGVLWGWDRSNIPSSSTATTGSDNPTSSNSSSGNRHPKM